MQTFAIHGRKSHLSTWQQQQAAMREVSRYQYRSPNFTWRKDSPRNRAGVTVYLTLEDNQIEKTNVTISRNFYRGGERRYMNVSLASLRRLSSIAPLPLLTPAQFEAAAQAQVAQEMLDAGKSRQAESDFRLIDRVDAAIAYGQVAEMVNDRDDDDMAAPYLEAYENYVAR